MYSIFLTLSCVLQEILLDYSMLVGGVLKLLILSVFSASPLFYIGCAVKTSSFYLFNMILFIQTEKIHIRKIEISTGEEYLWSVDFL